MSVSFLIQGVLPTFLGGRNDKIGTVTALWQCARVYKEVHSYYVLLSFILVYVTLQTFAIPGPIILSILSGALYPFLEANVLVALCATCGASLCFCLSSLLGRSLVQRFFPKMIANFKDKVRVLWIYPITPFDLDLSLYDSRESIKPLYDPSHDGSIWSLSIITRFSIVYICIHDRFGRTGLICSTIFYSCDWHPCFRIGLSTWRHPLSIFHFRISSSRHSLGSSPRMSSIFRRARPWARQRCVLPMPPTIPMMDVAIRITRWILLSCLDYNSLRCYRHSSRANCKHTMLDHQQQQRQLRRKKRNNGMKQRQQQQW